MYEMNIALTLSLPNRDLSITMNGCECDSLEVVMHVNISKAKSQDKKNT